MKSSRNTAAKTAIIDLISKSPVALSHIEIQNLTAGLCDRVTIYRILDRLVNDDSIHKIATPDGTIKYASCNHNHGSHANVHNHIHFNCEKCLAVTCLDSVVPAFSLPGNYKIRNINFTVTGLCPNCN